MKAAFINNGAARTGQYHSRKEYIHGEKKMKDETIATRTNFETTGIQRGPAVHALRWDTIVDAEMNSMVMTNVVKPTSRSVDNHRREKLSVHQRGHVVI